MFDYEDLDMAEDVKQALLAPAVSSSEKGQEMPLLLILL